LIDLFEIMLSECSGIDRQSDGSIQRELFGGLMRLRLVVLAFVLSVASFGALAQRASAPVVQDHEIPGTFSILGVDPVTGDIGAAVQSCVFSVNGVLWAEAGVGAVATQAIVDVSYGPQAMELLRKGMAPKEIIKTVWERDPDPQPATGPEQNQRNWTKQGRQFAVINAKGEMAAFTGPRADAWAGDKQGKFCTAQGNILAGQAVVDNMVSAFENTEKKEDGTRNHIAFRLLAALEAGQAAGGDTRCQRSASLLIVRKDGGPWLHNDQVLHLKVDDNPEPIKELRRLVEASPVGRSGRRGGGANPARGGGS
jgi:uncharacterized Ntn-hydrolase superfamily protein